MSSMREAGCVATTLYAVVDDPDRVVEIADWESAETGFDGVVGAAQIERLADGAILMNVGHSHAIRRIRSQCASRTSPPHH
jgi:S-adenosylhomocysteine hydrolase